MHGLDGAGPRRRNGAAEIAWVARGVCTWGSELGFTGFVGASVGMLLFPGVSPVQGELNELRKTLRLREMTAEHMAARETMLLTELRRQEELLRGQRAKEPPARPPSPPSSKHRAFLRSERNSEHSARPRRDSRGEDALRGGDRGAGGGVRGVGPRQRGTQRIQVRCVLMCSQLYACGISAISGLGRGGGV